ncbi:substrate-binding domain-containing protein [Streptomyces sp. ST1015]|nr:MULTISPECIES: substrate-binding domain-containing protein [unclassified Streptomyces]
MSSNQTVPGPESRRRGCVGALRRNRPRPGPGHPRHVHPRLRAPPYRRPGRDRRLHRRVRRARTRSPSTLREAGPRVPRDVSVIGFDDGHCTTDLSPSLTTVQVPDRRTAHAGPGGDDHVVLSPRLLFTESMRAPR